MIKFLSGFLLISLLFFSCARKIAVNHIPTTKEMYSTSRLVEAVNKNAIHSKWIQAKAQVSLDGGGFFSSGTINIRSCKDSLIWISVSKLGLEIGRGLVRSDSAFVTNDWENTFWQGSLEEIGMKYNVPAGLTDIQALIFPALAINEQYLMMNTSPNYELLKQGQPSKKYQISDNPETLIQGATIATINAELKVKYQDYEKQTGYWFPLVHQHQFIHGTEIRETKLRFSQVAASDIPLNTPFYIPSDYTLIK